MASARVTVAGLPCEIERRDRAWVVTVASVTVSKGADLAKTIVAASGGLVPDSEATSVAALVSGRLAAESERGSRPDRAAPGQ